MFFNLLERLISVAITPILLNLDPRRGAATGMRSAVVEQLRPLVELAAAAARLEGRGPDDADVDTADGAEGTHGGAAAAAALAAAFPGVQGAALCRPGLGPRRLRSCRPPYT